eukprot:12928422-Prorocentrum_lima.AAC.1
MADQCHSEKFKMGRINTSTLARRHGKGQAAHAEWFQKTPTEQAALDAKFVFGEEVPIPPYVSRLE